jgi:trans-aconitate methyltransferase
MSASEDRKALWDERYAASEQLWSGRVNPVLEAEAAELAPGRALDAGCGEGGDAMWLAERGWNVTAIDVSVVAVNRATVEWKRRAIRAGAAMFKQRDLTEWSPPVRSFALVSAQYLHVQPEVRDTIFRRLADAVQPGGVLLVVLHDLTDLALDIPRPPEQTMIDEDALRGYADGFSSVSVDVRPRPTVDGTPPVIDRAGHEATAHDLVLLARR